jgi:Protein of unknown function (DUF3592)
MSISAPRLASWILQGMGLLFMLTAVGLYLLGWVWYRDAITWPVTDGTILATEVLTEESRSGTGRNASTTYSYRPVFRYAYRVAGRSYEGSAFELNNPASYGEPEEAEAVLADYPVNGKTMVHYDPEAPETAVLIVNKPDLVLNIFLFLFGALLVGVAAAVSRWFVAEESREQGRQV